MTNHCDFKHTSSLCLRDFAVCAFVLTGHIEVAADDAKGWPCRTHLSPKTVSTLIKTTGYVNMEDSLPLSLSLSISLSLSLFLFFSLSLSFSLSFSQSFYLHVSPSLLTGPISRNIAILSLRYPISRDTSSGRCTFPQNVAIPPRGT